MKLSKGVVAIAAVAAVAALPAAAQASTVLLGSPLVSPFVASGEGEVATVMNIGTVGPGGRLTSPVNGAIVRWSVSDGEGPLRLRLLRPAGGTAYTAVASSNIEVPPGFGKTTFSTNLPVRAGDTIGLEISTTSRVGAREAGPGSIAAAWNPTILDGETREYTLAGPGIEYGFNAEVQPQPTVTSLSQASGPFTGGTPVTIAGADFTGVSAVKFGAIPAAFSVGSEGEITTSAPAGAAGDTNVTVTSIAGTSPIGAASRFTYTACKVPKIKKKKLRKAKKLLRQAGCKPGAVKRKKGVKARAGKVVKQNPKPGATLRPGAKINLTLR